MSTRSSRITSAERAFLQQLFDDAAQAGKAAADKRGETELEALGADGRRLLEMLSKMDAVLLAEDAQQQLRFKLSVVPCSFGGPGRLRLSAPLISPRRGTTQQPKKAAKTVKR